MTLGAASNHASTLNELERFAEAKSLMRKTMPTARRVLGGNHVLTLMMRKHYARRSTGTPPARLLISASPWRRTRIRNGSRGECWVVRTHSQPKLSKPCERARWFYTSDDPQ